jgi:3-phenylpropionate/trans-cinnamate dioxygenase ferredoxin reductase subunit
VSGSYALLIVGGGPAGLAAARAYRELEPRGRVAMITDERRLPYNRPALTKELLQGQSTADELTIEPEEWFDEHRVELIAGRAVALDTFQRTVSLSGGRSLGYRACLLATGAEPRRPTVPGADHPRVAVMRTLDDLRRLEDHLGTDARVAVIGSGFIACEIASSLRIRGHAVELVSSEAAPNAARLGEQAAAAVAGWLREDGVEMHMGGTVESIAHQDGACTVITCAHEVRADLVVLGTGVTPRSELARAAGLTMQEGAIMVDAGMRTSAEGVLAAGDVARAENLAARRRLAVEHWGDALGQGAVAGQTAAGAAAVWDAVPGFWSTIGGRTLKYTAWGDGFDDLGFAAHGNGGFSVRYGAAGKLVGVLTHRADEDYESAAELISRGTAWTS